MSGLTAAPSIALVRVLKPDGPQERNPVRETTQALMEGDVQTAYQFLGENIRSSLSVQAFERLYSKHGNAMQKEAMMLLAGMQEAVQKDEVWVSLGEHRAHLVRTKDGWRLTGVLQKSPVKDGATSEAAP